MRQINLAQNLMFLAALFSPLAVHCAELAGKVIAVDNGQPVFQSAVTLTLPDSIPGPKAITVFTTDDGSFRFPDQSLPEEFLKHLDSAALAAHKIGFKQVSYDSKILSSLLSHTEGRYEITLFVESTDNIADQVPASAWFKDAPASAEKNITLVSCSGCHQLPTPRVKEYAAKIEAVRGGPEGDKQALEAWRKIVRHEAWRTIVKYMRSMHYAVFPLESAVNLDVVDWLTAQDAEYNFFNAKQGEIVAQYMAEHFPRSTASMSRNAYDYGAPLGVTENTVIREYLFPSNALVREMVPAPDTEYLWGADVKRNMIVRLNPGNGETKWYPVDFEKSTGPHTIVPDDDGNLWVSMVDNDQFGRFDPRTEKWTLWTLRPSNLPNSESLAGLAIVHDMSIDSRGHLARDPSGKIWLTIVGTNQLGTLDPATGAVAFYDTNHIKGLSPINHVLYATVLTEDGTCAWYSQVNGFVGCIDTSSKKIKKLLPFPNGTGPRRMARDNAGNLWVAFFGTGEVAKIDMASGKLLKRFAMPDRSAAPYSVTWDERRKCVWVANVNSDAIYRLDPDTGGVKVYPLPRQMAYLRQIGVDQETGQLVGTYGNYPEGSGPSMGVMIDIGD